jgi:hypothetical protein
MWLTLILLIHSYPTANANPVDKPTSYVHYFQPLSELPPHQSMEYVKSLRRHLKNTGSVDMEKQLYSNSESSHCKKQRRPSCREAIYGADLCIPEKQVASDFCEKISQPLKFNPFQDPLFDRLRWNKWALAINQICLKQNLKVCTLLGNQHQTYLKIHGKHKKSLKKSLGD